MLDLKNDKNFINDLINAFPEIKEGVLDEDYEGLTSLQIGVFRRFTQKAIDANDLETVKKCFDFADENVGLVEHCIENSLYISYLGKLKFTSNNAAEKLLSPKQRNLIDELNKYYSTLSKNERVNKFLDDLARDS